VSNTQSSTQSTGLIEELREELYSGLLTFDQARTALGVSKYTLAKMLKAGDLTTVKIGPRVFISKGVLTAYIKAVQENAGNGVAPDVASS
jgi:excisionase family DNA binding protein